MQASSDDVDAAMGAHPGDTEAVCPTVPGSGEALACQAVTIAFKGQAAHAAADPYNGINALDAVILTFNGINALRQHVKTRRAFARNRCQRWRSGKRDSRLRRSALLRACRYPDIHVRAGRKGAQDRRRRCAHDRSHARVLVSGRRILGHDHELHPGKRAEGKYRSRLGLSLPDAKAEEGTGSTDWGNVSYAVPSVETGFPIVASRCTWHSQDVVDASESELGYENTFLVGKAMALTAIDLIEHPETLQAIKSEFASSLSARQATR